MNASTLPEKYRGYSVKHLLDLWDQIANRGGIAKGTPDAEILAMRSLLREHQLAPVHWRNLSKEEQKARENLVAQVLGRHVSTVHQQ